MPRLVRIATMLALLALPTTMLSWGQNASPGAITANTIILDRVTSAQALPNGLEVHCGKAILRLTALRDDLLRLRVGATGALPEDASWAVLPASRVASVPVAPESDAASVGFKTAKLHVTLTRRPLTIAVTDLAGNVLFQTLAERPIEFHGTSFRVYQQSPADEHYFGLGDKPGPLDRRNQAFANWNTDAFGWQESTDPIYKSIPFFLAFRKGICAGLFLDNTWRSSFDFNKEYRDGYSFGSEGGPLDTYLLYGPTPKAVESAYAWLTGPTPLPPLWALGYQQSRYSYYPESEVRRIAAKLRSERIPADTIYMDIDYQIHNRPFTVDPQKFPHFVQMVQDLKAQDFHLILITDLHIAQQPGIGYKPYDEGIAGDHFVKNPDGTTFVGWVWPGNAVFPDFTRKVTRDWWGTLYKDFVAEGVAGFWNDMNEPALFNVASKTMPDTVQHRIDEPGFAKRAASHLEIHNIFGMENSRGTYEGLRKLAPDTRPFVLTRASYAGGQRYAATWTGDNSSTWNHLRQTTPQLLNLGLSGFALSGADVGGFAGSPQPALLTRWLEIAAFHPIDRDHTADGTYPQEPWENGTTQDLNLRRRFLEERYRLLPYLYTVAEEMSRTGLPILRPLFLEFPDATLDKHPIDLNTNNSFLLGGDLLIAPSPYEDEIDDYSIALPPVGWYNYWTGERIPQVGNSEMPIRVHPSIDTLPVYARAGAILPIQPLTQSTMQQPQGPLTLRVYPPRSGGDCSGSVYLDDGISYAFEQGDYLRQTFTCTTDGAGITLHIAARQGSYQPWWHQLSIEIYGATRPAVSVLAAGTQIQAAYDNEHHRLIATIPDNANGQDITVNY